ncbi:MAG: chromosomal replication initiator protein DnaA, partial [Bacteroidales bacterium]|nr:chromosomal replication initiator protein DnaA [Bacteroidales bacterium]
FMHFYQSIGLLILDDIQELGGESRARTADVFFQIFNHLLQNGRQVVLASDKKPAELTGLNERLLSRFKSGLVAEVRQPDKETRLGIVKAKAYADGLALPDDVVQYVAANVSGNARELQGALVSLLAHATLTNTDITLSLAQSVVSELVSRPKNELITNDMVIEAVCDYFKIEPEKMQKNTRKREVVVARQIAMYLCKKLTTDSLSTIGASLGNRNHSTVVYACRSIEGLIETDSKIAEAVMTIEESLK